MKLFQDEQLNILICPFKLFKSLFIPLKFYDMYIISLPHVNDKYNIVAEGSESDKS